MDKKTKAIILFLGAYMLVFWIGFKSGTIYLRMKNRVQVEKVVTVVPPAPPQFYIVEKRDYGSYSAVTYESGDEGNNTIIQMFMNEKVRPLLKSRNIKIYKSTGEQVY